jgi:hypothetical protein
MVSYLGADTALLISGLFCVSSKRRIITSHLVLLQICFADVLTASESRVSPAARSTASIGMAKLSSGASSGIIALGNTKAPADSSRMFGVDGDDGFAARTTFAKWVGTAMFGGEPITSCVYAAIGIE